MKTKKVNDNWKYVSGRRHVPDAAAQHLKLFIAALLLEAEERRDALKGKAMGKDKSMYENEYRYWMNCATFLKTRLDQGLKSISDGRWKQAQSRVLGEITPLTDLTPAA